ncbi:MAG: MraY family glycosyltransferase [Gammaproteobacteria bacterium]
MLVYLPYLAPFLAFLISSAVLRVIVRSDKFSVALDHSNHRSLHSSPTSRLGGAAVMAGVSVSGLLVSMKLWPILLTLVGFLFAVSLADDIRGLPVKWRLMSHALAAGTFLWLAAPSGILGSIGLAIALVWVINLYNFMDGSDGLAGGMSGIGFGFLSIAAWSSGDIQFALLCLSISASSAGFLIYNFYPAKIFLGDSGSIPLGFLAGSMSVLGAQRGNWPLWFPFVVFSSFIVDATLTLFSRLLHGEKIWLPHREHFYQRLIMSGFSHRKTALAEYGLMVTCGALGLLAMQLGITGRFVVAGVLCGLYGVAVVTVNRRGADHLL